MAVVINTNVDSIKIQNLLSSSTSRLSESMQRMSSGLKIMSASDDAAGSVISARMQVQLNGNQIAQKNVQNGSAMLSTAEGNIDVVLDNMSRIRDLTLQAKNGTYSSEEIAAMQAEVNERMAEIDRVSSSSKYSQLYLFGSEELEDGVKFQVGANSTDDNVIEASGDIFKSIEFHALTGRTKGTDEVVDYAGASATQVKAANDTDNALVEISRAEYLKLKEEGETVKHYQFFEEDAPTADENTVVADKYYAEIAKTDITAQGLTEATLPTLTDDYASFAEVTTEKTYTLDLTVLDDEGFKTAINDLDGALDNLTARKSLIGSAHNRLDSAHECLATQYENLTSAKSIITDADIASEASNFTQQQILQQVSTSILAQANQAPSVAMSLI